MAEGISAKAVMLARGQHAEALKRVRENLPVYERQLAEAQAEEARLVAEIGEFDRALGILKDGGIEVPVRREVVRP